MGGLQRICKLYGSMTVKDNNGKSVRWLWDYVNDKARLESEMTKEEIAASEKSKWEGIKKQVGQFCDCIKDESDGADVNGNCVHCGRKHK